MAKSQTSRVPLAARAGLAGLLLFAGSTLPALGLDLNGFLPRQGQGTLAISFTSESYDEFWRGTTKVSNPGVGEVKTRSTTAWLTWGLTRDVSLVANFAYVDADSDGLGGFEDSGTQDMAALVQYRFAEASAPVLRVTASWSLGAFERRSATTRPTPRSRSATVRPTASSGSSTTSTMAASTFPSRWASTSAAATPPTASRSTPKLGVTAGRLTATGFYTRYLADGGTDIGDPGFTFPSNRDEFERLGIKLYGQLTARLGLHLLGFTTLDGRNSGDASGLSFGGSFHF